MIRIPSRTDGIKYVIWIMCALSLVTDPGLSTETDGEHDETGFILLKNDRPVDQNVLEGEPVRLHCAAEKAVNYVIWYYQRFSLFTDESKTYGGDSEATLNLDHEVTELAVCQPGISCKEKHSIPDLKIHHTGVLSIARAEMRHSGKYGCTIVEGINTKTAYILLTVNVHPSIPVIKRKFPSDTLVNTTKEGDLLILTCSSVRSYPLAKLTWLKITEGKSEPEQIIPSSLVSFRQTEQTDTRPAGILVTSEVRLTLSWLDHLKHIMCKAKNRVGSAFSEPFPIHVHFLPRIRPFKYNPWTVVQDHPASIECLADANPPASVYWLDQIGRKISQIGQMNSSDFLSELLDETEHKNMRKNMLWQLRFTCIATNILGMTQKILTIEVHFAPIVTTNKLVYAQLGQSVRLSCEALANPPVSRIFWFRKSVDSQGLNKIHAKNKTLLTRDAITDPNSVTNSTVSRGYRYWFSSALQINSLDHDDAGVYHCVAENTVHESGKQPSNQRTTEVSMLYVYYPPGEPTIAADIPAHVSVGSALKIECRTNDRVPGFPLPTFRWMWRPRSCKGVQPLKEWTRSDSAREINNSNYTYISIEKVESRDDGSYFCEVQNEVGQAVSLPVNVSVEESPRIIEPSDQPAIYTALLNEPSAPTRLQCIARGKPAPFIRWLHNKVPVNHKIMGEFPTDPMGTGPTMLRTALDPRIHIEYSVTCVQISAVEFTLESRFDLVWNGPLEVDDEGIYTCQAESPSAMSAFKQIHLKLSYSPKLLHPQIIRQALTSSLPSTTLPARKEKYKGFSNILNDHGSSVDGGEMDYSIVCYFRMNPPPRKMIWEYVSEKTLRKITGSANINASGGARCQHMSQIKPIAMYTEGQHKVTNGNMKAEMLYGNSARSFLQNMAGISLNYSETVVLSRLSASTEYVLRPGTYASHVDNGMGCETCYVQIQNRTRPEAPKILPMRNVTHNSAMLIWYTGFDGGYRQKLAVHYTKVKENDKGNSPHLLFTDETTPSSSSSGILLVNSTPRIPAMHQCLLSGLIPEATYQIVITGENELGSSLPSNTVQFSTRSVEIPQPENISRIDKNLQIHFSPSIALTGYCIRVDRAKLDCSDWVQIYDDCPLREVKNGVGDPNTVQLTNCKVSLNLPEYKPKSEAGPAVSKNSGIIKAINDADSTRRSDDVNGSTHYSTSPVISFRIYKNNEYAPKAGGNSSNDARFRRVDHGPFQYRVSTCLANQPNMCGPAAEWKESGQLNDEKTKPYSVFAILCICGGVLAFVVLISTMGGIFMAQWRRRTERRRVWVRQCEKGTEKQLFSPTRKVYGKFSWRDENGTRDTTSEDVTKVETEETVPLNPLPSTAPSNTVSQVVYQPICTMSSFPTCTSEHTLINPKIIYEVQSPITALPVYSTGPTQPYSTPLGTPMIGPCISITTPDLLVSDVKEGTELKTSPVILISAKDLSKLKLTSSVQSDLQHLVLALPTQSSSMQRFTP